MIHDFSLVFDTESPYWQRVLNIFEENENYEVYAKRFRDEHFSIEDYDLI